MRRRSELVALRVEDIEWLDDDGASILLRRSKTDQLGPGKWIHLSTEATAAVQGWLAAGGINSGFLLRGIRASGKVTDSLCESRISRIYKHLARKANIQEQLFARSVATPCGSGPHMTYSTTERPCLKS